MTDNIHPYRRQRLEPEISAVSIELGSNSPPLTIVNRDARRSSAVMAIKKLRAHALLAAVAGMAIEWLIRLKRRHLATAAVGTISATSAVVIGVTPMIVGDGHPGAPPVTIQVVTIPPTPAATRTVTAQPRRLTAAPTRSPRPTPTKRASRPAVSAKSPYPTSPASPASPSRSPRQTASAAPSVTAPRPTIAPSITAPRPTSPTPRPPSASPAPSSAAPTGAEATQPPQPTVKNCTIRVDLDPLLDVCVL